MGCGTATDSASEDGVIGLHSKRGVRTSQRATVHDPWNIWSAQTIVDSGKGSMLSEVGVVGNCWHMLAGAIDYGVATLTLFGC